MPWTYQIVNGGMRWPAGNLLAQGYSGAPGAVNNPAMIAVADYGPIPVGAWEIGAPYDDAETGPFTLPLTPTATTETFGRTGFKIHGDDIALAGLERASKGCIVLGRFAREAIWANEDRRLNVVAASALETTMPALPVEEIT